MSDSESDIEVSDTEEEREWFTPSKGKPVTITSTNRDMWIVLGHKREFEVQFLQAGQETTITPNQGKVGIVTKKDINPHSGNWSFTVDLYKLYKVKPKLLAEGNILEAKAESRKVEVMQDVSTSHIKPTF